MHEHTATGVKCILNELVAGWEVFHEVLVVHVINLDDLVRKALKQVLI